MFKNLKENILKKICLKYIKIQMRRAKKYNSFLEKTQLKENDVLLEMTYKKYHQLEQTYDLIDSTYFFKNYKNGFIMKGTI